MTGMQPSRASARCPIGRTTPRTPRTHRSASDPAVGAARCARRAVGVARDRARCTRSRLKRSTTMHGTLSTIATSVIGATTTSGHHRASSGAASRLDQCTTSPRRSASTYRSQAGGPPAGRCRLGEPPGNQAPASGSTCFQRRTASGLGRDRDARDRCPPSRTERVGMRGTATATTRFQAVHVTAGAATSATTFTTPAQSMVRHTDREMRGPVGRLGRPGPSSRAHGASRPHAVLRAVSGPRGRRVGRCAGRGP
jgi:hypothetical protein